MSDKVENLLENLINRLSAKAGNVDISKVLKDAENRRRELLMEKIAFGLEHWRMDGKEFVIGNRFVISPSWLRNEVRQNNLYIGKDLIIIDPGIAFGSSHGTTIACINALEHYWHGGRLLDVGTGTGILAIAAYLMQPASKIEAFDINPDIVEHASLHLKLNHLENQIDLSVGAIDKFPVNEYDLVIANLLPEILELLRNDLVERVKPGGRLVISGFPEKSEGKTYAQFDWNLAVSKGMDAKDVSKMFNEKLKLIDTIVHNDWVALVFEN